MICRNIELKNGDKISYINTNELTYFLQAHGFNTDAIAIFCLHLIKGKQYTIDGKTIIKLRNTIQHDTESIHYIPNTEINY